MPHLSPMSWLSILLLLWLVLMFMSASSFFSQPGKFLEPQSKTTITSNPKWKWLQGGRVMNNKL